MHLLIGVIPAQRVFGRHTDMSAVLAEALSYDHAGIAGRPVGPGDLVRLPIPWARPIRMTIVAVRGFRHDVGAWDDGRRQDIARYDDVGAFLGWLLGHEIIPSDTKTPPTRDLRGRRT